LTPPAVVILCRIANPGGLAYRELLGIGVLRAAVAMAGTFASQRPPYRSISVAERFTMHR
jgi:hypothetical protein